MADFGQPRLYHLGNGDSVTDQRQGRAYAATSRSITSARGQKQLSALCFAVDYEDGSENRAGAGEAKGRPRPPSTALETVNAVATRAIQRIIRGV